MIIYKITNKKNGMCYIGETSKSLARRKSQHIYEAMKRGLNDKLHKAIREDGKENFTFEVIAKAPNYRTLTKMERNLIMKHDSITNGYNTQIRNDYCGGGGNTNGFSIFENNFR